MMLRPSSINAIFRAIYQSIFIDDFAVLQSAPLPTPRTAVPGIGTETLIQTDGQFSIVAAGLNVPAQGSAIWGDLGGFKTTGIERRSGRVIILKCRFSSIASGGIPLTLFTTPALNTTATNNQVEGVSFTSTSIFALPTAAVISAGAPSTATNYNIALWLRSTGAFYYFLGSSLYALWSSRLTSSAGSQSIVYPGWSNFNNAFTIRKLAVLDFPAVATIAEGNALLRKYLPNGI